MNKEDKIILDCYIEGLLLKKPIKTGLTKKEVIKFIDTNIPITIYALLLDKDTIVLHKVKKK